MYVNGPTNDETTASDTAPRTPISQRANPYGYADYEGLGFSLKPPKFVRKAVKKIGKTGAIIGAVASVLPLPGGSIASRVASGTVGKLFKRGEKISKDVKGAVKRVAVSPAAPSLPIPVAQVAQGASTAPTESSGAPTASPTGGVVPEVQLTPISRSDGWNGVDYSGGPMQTPPTVERQALSTAQRVLRAGQRISSNIDRARAAADSLSKAAAAAADAGDQLGARRLAEQARQISEGAANVATGAAQASGAVTGAAEGAVTGAAAATAGDQLKKFLDTTTGKVVAGGAVLGGVMLLTSGKGGSSQSWR